MTPAYPVSGSPAAIVAKAGGMRTHGTGFTKVADGLDSITTDGWASKSAGMFHEQFQPESGRWRDSGAGFVTAATALEAYAGQLQSAQDKASWCRQEWDRGERASVSARAALSDGRKVTGDQRLLSSFVNSQADDAGENLRLLSSSTGATDAGLAQNLANKMGVTVEAPSDTLWIWRNGFMHIGFAADVANGSWRVFTPGGCTP